MRCSILGSVTVLTLLVVGCDKPDVDLGDVPENSGTTSADGSVGTLNSIGPGGAGMSGAAGAGGIADAAVADIGSGGASGTERDGGAPHVDDGSALEDSGVERDAGENADGNHAGGAGGALEAGSDVDAGGGAGALEAGGDVMVSADAGVEAADGNGGQGGSDSGTLGPLSLATDGNNPRIAVGPNGEIFVAFGRQYLFSSDGENWGPLEYAPGTESPNGTFAPPSGAAVSVDPQGNFAMTWDDFSLYVARASTGETTFGDRTNIGDGDSDNSFPYYHPAIDALPDGSVLVGHTKNNEAVIQRSGDGTTWTTASVLDVATAVSPRFCHAPDGSHAYVIYDGSGDTTVKLASSIDSGRSWTAGVAVANTNAIQGASCVADGDNVWVAYTKTDGTSDSRIGNGIRIHHSSDGGQSFPEQYDVIDAGMRSIVALPPVIVRDCEGRLDIVYYTGDSLEAGHGSVRWARASSDVSQWEGHEIKSGVMLFMDRTSGWDLGDDFGAVTQGCNLYVVFSDNSDDSDVHPVFYRTSVQ